MGENNQSLSPENNPIEIVIVGGGTAGWMAANAFVKRWPSDKVKVTLVESQQVGIIGVGEGSTPSLKKFFDSIDVAEEQWMTRCNATYKLNIRFEGWSPESGINSYSHPFTSQTDVHTASAFLTNSRTRRLGLKTNTTPEDFLINGVLAKQGKGPIAAENFPFAMAYGYHFDSHLLGEFLSEIATSRGVDYRPGHVSHVNRDSEGDITSINTSQEESISGDFFVDCTGFASVLMQKTLDVRFNRFNDNLFNDSAVVMQSPISEDFPVETVSTALSSGWCWKIPLLNRYGNGYVYSSQFISDEQAEIEFREQVGMLEEQGECRRLKMKVGQLEQHWSHNCIALGLSQGFIEPLEATALHLVQLSIENFASSFDKGDFSNQYRDEFNQSMTNRFERVRDYIVAHYKLNTRTDSEYWRANRDNNHLSESLLGILDAWFKRDDLEQEINRQGLNNHFDSVAWNCLLSGYGAFPPLASIQPGKGDLYLENEIERFLHGCSLNFKSHEQCLFRNK